MDVSNEFIAVIGDTIRFRTYDGEFEGIVKSIQFKTKQVTVRNVYDLLQNVCIGDSTFFFNQFLTYSAVSKFRNPEIGKSELLLDSKTKFSKNDCNKAVSYTEMNSKQASDQFVAKTDPNYGEFVSKLPPNLQHVLPDDSVILDCIDLEFKCATTHISRQSVIGVSFQGYEISRIGKLFWICIATKYCVFLFDIQELEESAFDHGLRNIFQDQNIIKVIHDCRRPSDCIYHTFSTTLSNVFDTQVADFVIKQTIDNKSNLVNLISLEECLENYLGVPKEFLFVSKMNVEANYFSKRPLDNECRNILIKDTLYLTMLREKLRRLMFSSVYKASDFYLKVVADSPKLSSDPSTIPSALLEQGLKIVALPNDYLKPSVTITASDLIKRSLQTDRCEKKLAGRNICKNATSDFDCNLKDKQGSKLKHPSTPIPQTPETLVNNAKMCSVVGKAYSRSKIHDNEKFDSASKITSNKKDLESDHLALISAFRNSNLQKNVTNKFKVSANNSLSNAHSKLGLQIESNDFNITKNSVLDYNDTWNKLRSTCGASKITNMTAGKSNIKFIPSGNLAQVSHTTGKSEKELLSIGRDLDENL